VVASRSSMPPPSGGGASFNPLHCGAVVASARGPAGPGLGGPSFNPLHCGAVVASGQEGQARQDQRQGFNPLHCGAVVASCWRCRTATGNRQLVSIPFIAGQWSLPPHGGWARRTHDGSFNPLHCGAVVASPPSLRVGYGAPGRFQSPSLRGSGRFALPALEPERRSRLVSIPFIAGQWSLHVAQRVDEPTLVNGFNPLHCGAVVASGKK